MHAEGARPQEPPRVGPSMGATLGRTACSPAASFRGRWGPSNPHFLSVRGDKHRSIHVTSPAALPGVHAQPSGRAAAFHFLASPYLSRAHDRVPCTICGTAHMAGVSTMRVYPPLRVCMQLGARGCAPPPPPPLTVPSINTPIAGWKTHCHSSSHVSSTACARRHQPHSDQARSAQAALRAAAQLPADIKSGGAHAPPAPRPPCRCAPSTLWPPSRPAPPPATPPRRGRRKSRR